ncbi:MAG TPA: WD40 repeat domain-containing protein [Cytophagales bacterium]|nr:WD40 repeat domain-containing protein [Cytophagales bacterium]
MKNKLLDKISLSLFVILLTTIGYIIYEFTCNAFQTHKHWVYSVDVNEKGLIASASENQILLWDNKYCIDSLIGHNNAIKSISFSKDGQFLASASIDNTVKIWSITDKKNIKTFDGHHEGVNKVDFSNSDNYLISAGYDNKLFIWDWKNETDLKEFEIKHTVFSINNSDILAFVDTSCKLNLFDLNTLSIIKVMDNFCGLPVFHPNGKTLAIRTDNGSLQFIDSYSGKLISVLDIKHETSYGPFIFTPDGNYIVAGIWGGSIELWDWKGKMLVKTLHGTFATSTNELSFNNRNQLLSASGDQSVKIWDLDTGSLKTNLGDGLYQKQLLGVLSIIFVATLVVGFFGVNQSNDNKYSSLVIISILSAWSLGILTLGLFAKKHLVKYSTVIIWILTVISGLAILSLYGAWLSLFFIPVSLFFGFIKLQLDREKKEIMIPIIINLFLCGVFASFIVSAGLWR